MSETRSRNTRPEIELRKALHRLGLNYRLLVRDLPDRPGIAFPAAKSPANLKTISTSAPWRRPPPSTPPHRPRSAHLVNGLRGENLLNKRVEAAIASDGAVERALPRTLWLEITLR